MLLRILVIVSIPQAVLPSCNAQYQYETYVGGTGKVSIPQAVLPSCNYKSISRALKRRTRSVSIPQAVLPSCNRGRLCFFLACSWLRVSIPQAVLLSCNRSMLKSLGPLWLRGFNTASGNALLQPVAIMPKHEIANTFQYRKRYYPVATQNNGLSFPTPMVQVSIPQAVLPSCNASVIPVYVSSQEKVSFNTASGITQLQLLFAPGFLVRRNLQVSIPQAVLPSCNAAGKSCGALV